MHRVSSLFLIEKRRACRKEGFPFSYPHEASLFAQSTEKKILVGRKEAVFYMSRSHLNYENH